MALAPQQNLLVLIQGFNRLPNSRKLGLIAALAATVAVVVVLYLWVRAPDYRVLYSNLSDQDGGAIIAALQQQNIPYKTAEGGRAILVPADQVYDVRFRLAAQGLPRGGTVGFELMEDQKLGLTQFQEQVNYQRALEGELARSIQSLSPVQSARVHLAIPKPSVFVRDRQPPTASVVVQLYPGRVLAPSQVTGIVHIVSSSVPELPVSNVTVVDQSGNLLSAAGSRGAKVGLDPSQLDYLRQVEEDLVGRVEHILAPLVGVGNVRAQVTADLDFSQVESTAETFKPNPGPEQAAIRSQQSAERFESGAGQLAQGVPGALSNRPPGVASAPLDAPPGAAGKAGRTGAEAAAQPVSSQKESTVNYELDKTIRHVKSPVGGIKRLSAAVVVNYKKDTGKGGKVSFKPRTPEEMTQIQNLVKEAMGFNGDRGDTLNVVNASFTQVEEAEPVPVWKDQGNVQMVKELLKNLLLIGVALYLVFGILRPLLRDLAKHPEPSAGEREAKVGEVAAQPAAPAGARRGFEADIQAVRDMAKQDPRIVANVVKQWVGSE
jgi:flagellar M-ring protein FliF